MKFDYTHGNSAKYMVSIHRWNGSDQYYCESFKQAKDLFNQVTEKGLENETSVSIWDMKKDIRKEFARG
jgi:hypothetical protein